MMIFRRMKRICWLGLAWLFFAIGFAGMFLPLLPTTVFMLLALACASRGSPRFARYIREHPQIGPPLISWERERAIPLRARILAVGMLVVSMLIILFTVSVMAVKVSLLIFLSLLAIWLGTRPEPRGGYEELAPAPSPAEPFDEPSRPVSGERLQND
ncbi:YbaN family protein [Cobetia marina]|uniref:YbaN family protein n=1 Tax=Cobetia marina TaxID=28258 RepID=A0ABU9GCL5_COBMA|nr:MULTISPECIES: YbaN family protein [Cobetia]MDH2290355.1 YbaN family protein [Cobetia sp. 10Alg 146]MDH2372278.1 YbaN family protein [Cobetia sp. 3AK]MDI6002107.1 YbaN family protein [Cobetia pacifica]MDN2655222.1 YbaN family protein [Cobetia sp. 14N.309.X.WAT.E.A4]MDO6787987.1 YbaN family protein [Cobetia marina]